MFGHYEPLLDIRRRMFDRVGYTAEIATNPAEVRQRLGTASGKYSLFLICHTTPPREEIELRSLAAAAGVPVYHVQRLLAPEQLMFDVSYLATRGAPTAATSRL
jgi:hypothetical protein